MTPSTPRGTRVSHVGIAVEALSETLPFFRDVLGLREIPLDDADGASMVGCRAGEPLVELLEAETEEPPLGRSTANGGRGFNNTGFSVDDTDGTLERCRGAGIQLTDKNPRTG